MSMARACPSAAHAVQHLHTGIREIMPLGLPVWGSLTWFVVEVPDQKNFIGKSFSIALIAGGADRTGRARRGAPRRVEISLSDVMWAIGRFTAWLERELQAWLDTLPAGETRPMRDVLLFATVRAAPASPPVDPSSGTR
jgi:hypothetical protein